MIAALAILGSLVEQPETETSSSPANDDIELTTRPTFAERQEQPSTTRRPTTTIDRRAECQRLTFLFNLTMDNALSDDERFQKNLAIGDYEGAYGPYSSVDVHLEIANGYVADMAEVCDPDTLLDARFTANNNNEYFNNDLLPICQAAVEEGIWDYKCEAQVSR